MRLAPVTGHCFFGRLFCLFPKLRSHVGNADLKFAIYQLSLTSLCLFVSFAFRKMPIHEAKFKVRLTFFWIFLIEHVLSWRLHTFERLFFFYGGTVFLRLNLASDT